MTGGWQLTGGTDASTTILLPGLQRLNNPGNSDGDASVSTAPAVHSGGDGAASTAPAGHQDRYPDSQAWSSSMWQPHPGNNNLLNDSSFCVGNQIKATINTTKRIPIKDVSRFGHNSFYVESDEKKEKKIYNVSYACKAVQPVINNSRPTLAFDRMSAVPRTAHAQLEARHMCAFETTQAPMIGAPSAAVRVSHSNKLGDSSETSLLGVPPMEIFGIPSTSLSKTAAGFLGPSYAALAAPPSALFGKSTDMFDTPSGMFDSPSGSPDTLGGDDLAHLVRTAPAGFQLPTPVQLTLRQLQSLGSSVLGWQVLVQGGEGSFLGYLCWMLDHCGRLGLEEVSRPASGVRRVGLLLLYYRHVHSVTLLARRASTKLRPQKSNLLEERTGRSLLMKKLVPPHLVARRRAQQQEAGLEEEGEEQEDDIPPLPPPVGRLLRPNAWCVVDTIGDHYQQAVASIAGCRRLGLSCFGHQLGRWGQLAWLCVATQHTVYLFDAATLGLDGLLYGRQHSSGKDKRNKSKGQLLSNAKTDGADDTANNNGGADTNTNGGTDTAGGTDDAGGAAAVTDGDDLAPVIHSTSIAEKHSPLTESFDEQQATHAHAVDAAAADQREPLLHISQCGSTDEGKHHEEAAAMLKEVDCSSSLTSRPDNSTASNAHIVSALQHGPETHLSPNTQHQVDAQLQSDAPPNAQPQSDDPHSPQSHSPVSEPSQCAGWSPTPALPHLAAVLESCDVELVTHDARNLMDYMQHRAGVHLQSLYDTQACEVYLYLLLHRGDCPAFVPPLSALLTRRLHLPPSLADRIQRQHSADSSEYFERPLPEHLLSGLASSCVFLQELRHLQLRDVLADLRQLTAVHAAAHASTDDVMRARVEQHVVPQAVQQLGRRTVFNCLPPRNPSGGANTAAWGRHRTLQPGH